MKKTYKLKASLTLYFTLTLVLSAALVLALLESVRVYGIHTSAQKITNIVLESTFAEYQPILWEKYDFFAFNFSREIKENMSRLTFDNLNDTTVISRVDLYQMQLKDIDILSYELITDREGAAFEEQVASFMKKEMGEKAARKLLEKITGIENGNTQDSGLDGMMASASNTLKELSEEQQANAEKQVKKKAVRVQKRGEEIDTAVSVPENPMDTVTGMKQQGLLAFVLPSQCELSAKAIDTSSSLLKRSLKKGNYGGSSQNGWYERILLQEYISSRFGNFINPGAQSGLNYELEYILCGNDSDKSNLEEVVGKLLLLREAINYGYLLMDSAKMAEAMTLATVLAGISGNPVLIEVVRQGIIAAWASAESIVDIKCLLAQGKVPLLKTAETWKTQLSNIGQAVSETSSDGVSGDGYTYEEYLQKLLYLMSLKHISYRTMDIMESALHQQDAYEDAKMDEMAEYMSVSSTYEVPTIFLSAIGQKNLMEGFLVQKKSEYSYIRK